MNLDSTTKVVQIVTGSAANVDVASHWSDIMTADMSVVTPSGNTNTAITTATTTTVVAAPASGNQRRVTYLTARNKSAGTVSVLVQLYDGTTATELHQYRLASGQTLQYAGATGWTVLGSAAVPLKSWSYTISKSGTAMEAASQSYGFLKDQGMPGAWVPGTPGINGTDTNSLPGTVPLNFTGGDGYLVGAMPSSANTAAIELLDLLWYNTGISVTTTTEQTISVSYVPPRNLYQDGNQVGTQIGILVTAATTNGAAIAGMTIKYTSHDGTANRVATPIIPAGFPATAVVGTIVWFALDAGDIGVRFIQSVTLGTSLGAGSISLIHCYKICTCFVTANASIPAPIKAGGIRIIQGASLFMAAVATAATTALTVNLDLYFELRG